MKHVFILPVFIGCILFFGSCQSDALASIAPINIEDNAIKSIDSFFIKRTQVYTTEVQKAKDFLSKNRSYNQDVAILIDMRIPSNKFRLFVHDFKNDSIQDQALVAHGAGSDFSADSLVFSNTPNSNCTSLGKYKIGAKYTGQFGKSYKLHGLDQTNNNAYKRYVVFHPYSAVPDIEQEYPIILSLGCPMVSPNFMEKMYTLIDNSSKPILMVIYY